MTKITFPYYSYAQNHLVSVLHLAVRKINVTVAVLYSSL